MRLSSRLGPCGGYRPTARMLTAALFLPAVALADKFFEFTHESVEVLKRTVHGREADVGHFVQIVQMAHDLFADHRARDFFFPSALDDALDAVGGFLNRGNADRPFF